MTSSNCWKMAETLLQHVFSGDRMQAFSDAIFAIMATMLVNSVKLTEEDVDVVIDERDTLWNILVANYHKILIYLLVFNMVMQTWYNHVRVFRVVDKIDNFVIWLNLFCLLFSSFLPFTIALAGRLPGVPGTIAIGATNVFIVWITLAIVLWYGLRKQRMIHPEIKRLPDLKVAKFGMFLIILIIPAASLLAIGLSFINYVVGWIFFAPIGIMSMLTRLTFQGIQKCRGKSLNPDTNYLLKSVANKERTEFFTDGVFATVATLIVLELTEALPAYNPTTEEALNNFFASEDRNFSSYVTTYVILGLFWSLHHSLFQFLNKLSPIMSLLNSFSLALVGFIPFISDLLVQFASSDSKVTMYAANTTLQLASTVIFLISMCQIGMYVVANCDRAKYWAETDPKKEGLLVAKMAVFPLISFITFWATFSPQEYFNRSLLFDVLIWTAPVVFIAMKLVILMYNRLTNGRQIRNVERLQSV